MGFQFTPKTVHVFTLQHSDDAFRCGARKLVSLFITSELTPGLTALQTKYKL